MTSTLRNYARYMNMYFRKCLCAAPYRFLEPTEQFENSDFSRTFLHSLESLLQSQNLKVGTTLEASLQRFAHLYHNLVKNQDYRSSRCFSFDTFRTSYWCFVDFKVTKNTYRCQILYITILYRIYPTLYLIHHQP